MTEFANPLAAHVWRTRYRFEDEPSIDATLDRVAAALAEAEASDQAGWARRFRDALEGFRFLPGGRILAGAGTGRRVTLMNCFVMGTLDDSLEGIFTALHEAAITLQQGGGVGTDFSPLRPKGARTDATGGRSSGPVSFMQLWEQMCATVTDNSPRRGAMMGVMACDHPDIHAFVAAKRVAGKLTHFNVSVLVYDAFMRAVADDAPWRLNFPRFGSERSARARDLWDAIVGGAYASAEPGVLFIDRIRAEDNLAYCETISATNPCGEIPLPPYGACDLGSINLATFVRDPFTASARLDLEAVAAIVPVAVRMLDNVWSVTRFPVPAQAEQGRSSRRLGLGITGLGDALAMLGLRYDSVPGRGVAADAMRTIVEHAYAASVELARERGAFPRFEREPFLAAPFVARLPSALRDGIARHGLRNSHLAAIAPAGTISVLAGGVSSGIEPIYALEGTRRVRQEDGTVAEVAVACPALLAWRARAAAGASPPEAFVTATGITPEAQLLMQAALQPHVDNAISKTTNVAADIAFADFAAIYSRAFELGLKGCTVFRPNPVTGSILR
ncbi:ribonucleoside-diphosphate reductase alpha chain [Burkholderiales bacterium]|nr:ribonucleoside-diphosphate reductase alpha chain [Burkholderiales bacterium]